MLRTNKDIVTTQFTIGGRDPAETWTLPAGSRVVMVKGLSGTSGDGFAAADVAQLKRLSGNAHDPVYRYLVISAADVESDTESERALIARILANQESR